MTNELFPTPARPDDQTAAHPESKGNPRIHLPLQHDHIGIIVIDCAEQRIVDLNPSAQQMIQADRANILGAKCSQIFLSSDDLHCPCHQPETGNQFTDCQLLTAQGERLQIQKNASPFMLNGKKYLVETFIKTADRDHLERYILEQQTLAEALRDSAKVINQSLNLKEVLYSILEVIGKVVPHDSANVMLLEGNEARIVAWRGYDNLKGVRFTDQGRRIEEVPNLRRMAESGLPIVVPDTRVSANWVKLSTSTWVLSYVSAPICRSGKTIGFVNIHSHTAGFYTPQHAERLLAFADQAAFAIENARLYEQARQELEERKLAEQALQAAKNELEERVANRTLELCNANEQLKAELARRRLAEAALEEERALLALRVEERTAELSTANNELARAAEMKDSFLASMSHELRTPLSAILNHSETLLEALYGPLTEAQEKSLQIIQQSGRHLLVLINDMLDLSKIGAGQLELILDEVEVEPLCKSSLEQIREAARKKNMIVSTSIDPQVKVVWADARRMKQILVNLLNNAIKFTPVGGAIGLAVTADHEKKQVHFTVWDNGIGIPTEKMQLLFKPFIQLDSRLARNYEGTGLGLALVYKLVELHNGGISLDSEVGLGSRFTVSLKWQDETVGTAFFKPNQEQKSTAMPPDSERGTDVTLHFRRCLDELNLEAVGYWYERESVLKAVEGDFDLYVLDVRLLTKGTELLSLLIKAVEKTRTPILFLTQKTASIERPTLPSLTNYLDFPFSPQDARQMIRSIVPQGTASLVRKVAVFVERKITTEKRPPLIMLAEDNPVAARVFSDYLNALGYQVSLASNGTEVVERAREVIPDLILMDVHMPGMDGIAATQRIRRDASLQHIPVVAMTALVLPGERQRCLAAGANEFISKPFSMVRLEEVLRDQLSRPGKRS